MSATLIFPVISDLQGNIKPEYLESYNRDLTEDDLKKMSQLILEEEFQKLIDDFNVRKIWGPDHLLIEICHSLIQQNIPEMLDFVYRKLSYDDKARVLYELNEVPASMKHNIQNKLRKFGQDYSEEFDAMRARCDL